MTVHMSTEAENVASVMAPVAGRHFGGPATIEHLVRESGGASRQTWSFDAVVNGERRALTLRRDPPPLSLAVGGPAAANSAGGSPPSERSTSLDRATESRVLRAAFRAGVRAPDVLFELSP